MQTPHPIDPKSARRAVLALSVILGHVALAGQGSLEYQVKAAFLYDFVSFTQWPSSAFASASSPLHLCVLRDDGFASQLETTASGEGVHGHPLTVNRVSRDEDAVDAFLREGGIVNFVIENGHVRFDVNQTIARERSLTLSSRLLQVARSVK